MVTKVVKFEYWERKTCTWFVTSEWAFEALAAHAKREDVIRVVKDEGGVWATNWWLGRLVELGSRGERLIEVEGAEVDFSFERCREGGQTWASIIVEQDVGSRWEFWACYEGVQSIALTEG